MALNSTLHLWLITLSLTYPSLINTCQPCQTLCISDYHFSIGFKRVTSPLTLKADDQQGSVLSGHVTALFLFPQKGREAWYFIVALSKIGHDMFLFRVFETACSSVSLQWPGLLLFNHCFTKVWKNCQGSYYQTVNCSPVLTCCLVGLVIGFWGCFCAVFLLIAT